MYAEDLTFDIDKENTNDDSESDGEEKIGAALCDSDIDEFESHLVNMNLNYQSEEYSDDDTAYAPRIIDKTNKPRNDENNSWESDEYSCILGVPKELVQTKLKAPSSCFMRNGELLMVKFADKKATGDKEIYVIDSKGTAGVVQVERFEKGGSKKYISKPSSIIDYNGNMGGVDLSDSSLHHAYIDRKSYRCFVRDIMESTGAGRKPLTEFTPPQRRANSLPNSLTPQQCVNSLTNSIIPRKRIKIQHFSSRNNYDECRKRYIQKVCVLCHSKQIRKLTAHFCRTCHDAPALCYPNCFDTYHSQMQ
ncbi:unnamed protein product [Rotaria magnacalcarata]|uniref:PiggyBac transposable element-derived protein domain-containing protein n=1 Tax=Rotaria magnacalcarata TaxID=392030 RepID=A0A815HGU5_9BILA|nr:unnamed protein product [Rotaria magnacalcarata]